MYVHTTNRAVTCAPCIVGSELSQLESLLRDDAAAHANGHSDDWSGLLDRRLLSSWSDGLSLSRLASSLVRCQRPQLVLPQQLLVSVRFTNHVRYISERLVKFRGMFCLIRLDC